MTELDRIAQPDPKAAITRPATAGPTMRAAWKVAELRPIAFGSRSRPTTSETNDWRDGLSKAVPMPKAKAITYTIGVVATPVMARMPRVAAQMANQAWVILSTTRLSNRSATSPPYADSSSIGRNCRAVVMPIATPGAAGQLEHQPVLGDPLHPGADVGDEGAGHVDAEVGDGEGGEHAALGLLGRILA